MRSRDTSIRASRGLQFRAAEAGRQCERQQRTGRAGQRHQHRRLSESLAEPATAQPPLYFNFHTAELTVGFVPDVFGGNRRKVESLDAQAHLQRFELEATYITLASNVVAAAIQDASTRAQIAATREIIAHNEKSLTYCATNSTCGYATRIDLAAQEQQLAQAKALLPPLEKQFEQNRDLIRALVGNLPNQDGRETLELSSLKIPAQLPLSLPSKIIEQRPDVRAAEEQLRAANAARRRGHRGHAPAVHHYRARAAARRPSSRRCSAPGGPFWTLIGDVTQPVFAGGTLLHTKRAADQALRQAAAQYQKTVLRPTRTSPTRCTRSSPTPMRWRPPSRRNARPR